MHKDGLALTQSMMRLSHQAQFLPDQPRILSIGELELGPATNCMWPHVDIGPFLCMPVDLQGITFVSCNWRSIIFTSWQKSESIVAFKLLCPGGMCNCINLSTFKLDVRKMSLQGNSLSMQDCTLDQICKQIMILSYLPAQIANSGL